MSTPAQYYLIIASDSFLEKGQAAADVLKHQLESMGSGNVHILVLGTGDAASLILLPKS